MKTKLYLVLALFFFLFSCQNKEYTLTGTFNGSYKNALNGKKVIIKIYGDTSEGSEVSAVVENNTFTVEGPALDNAIAYVTWEGQEGKPFVFIPEKGNIDITIGDDGAKLAGSPSNIVYQNLLTSIHNQGLSAKKLKTTIEKLNASGNLSTDRLMSIEGDMNKVKDDIERLILNYFTKDNKNSSVTEYILLEYNKYIKPEKIKELIDGLQTPKDTEKLNKLKAKLDGQINVSAGKELLSLSGEDVNGNLSKLSDFVGGKKVLVVDFWASWCPPCRALAPKLKELEKKYNKDVTFVGVTLDKDKDAWLGAMKEDKVEWAQIATFKPDEIFSSYGISELPYLLVVDNKGIIRKAGSFDAPLLEGYIKMLLDEK